MADVYPVYHGPYVQYAPDIPAVPHLGISKAEAERLIKTGAFTYDKPPPDKAASKTEEPAKAGSSDSEE